MAAADGPTLDRVLAALEQQGAETAARFDQLQEVLVTMPQLRTSGVGTDGDDVGENELVPEIEPPASPPEPQPPPPSQYDDGEVYDIDKELQRLGAQITNLGRRRRQRRPNTDPIGALW